MTGIYKFSTIIALFCMVFLELPELFYPNSGYVKLKLVLLVERGNGSYTEDSI